MRVTLTISIPWSRFFENEETNGNEARKGSGKTEMQNGNVARITS